MCTSDGFKPRTATRTQIEARVKRLSGKTLGEIPLLTPSKKRQKNLGDIGVALESYFGLEGDSYQRPDFWRAEIELKAVPLVMGTKEFHCDQKTFITAINYMSIADEDWRTAHVRSKLNTLLVFVERFPGQEWPSYVVRSFHFKDFMAERSFARLAQRDWRKVKDVVKACGAHQLSASDGLVLVPATKGANAKDKSQQPCGPMAMRRSFALRQSFMKAVYRDSVNPRGREQESLLATLAPKGPPDLERLIRKRLNRYKGVRVSRVARQLHYPSAGSSRSYGADVVQLALGARSPRSRIAEFEEAGITIRRPRVNASMLPYEHISFPAFRANDLRNQEWDESELKAALENMLFVPLVGEHRTTHLRDCFIGEPCFWRPDDRELVAIGKEWTSLKDQLLAGKLEGLSREHIHMRPHARNSKDTDRVGRRTFTRKSYWLNKEFVASRLHR